MSDEIRFRSSQNGIVLSLHWNNNTKDVIEADAFTELLREHIEQIQDLHVSWLGVYHPAAYSNDSKALLQYFADGSDKIDSTPFH